MLRIFRFQTVQHCLQQDSLLSEADLSQYFAPDVAGPLADFVVAGSEDEEHAGSGCSASSKRDCTPALPCWLTTYHSAVICREREARPPAQQKPSF